MPDMDDGYLSIGGAAKLMGVSIDTLRRWDESGKFRAARTEGGHRTYRQQDIEIFLSNLWEIASDWTLSAEPPELPSNLYCPTSAVLQARLSKMQAIFGVKAEIADYFSLLVALAGEIGNNSFDHNIGNWPDVPGILFGFDIHKKQIVLADRGLGILQTLKRVRPELLTHAEALKVAFTEVLSGRQPEARGNGLKFVRKVVQDYPINLRFETGDASLNLKKQQRDLTIENISRPIKGCLALITF